MKLFVFGGGTLAYLVIGAGIDAVLPGLDLLGINVQALVFSTLCVVGALWLWVKLDLE